MQQIINYNFMPFYLLNKKILNLVDDRFKINIGKPHDNPILKEPLYDFELYCGNVLISAKNKPFGPTICITQQFPSYFLKLQLVYSFGESSAEQLYLEYKEEEILPPCNDPVVADVLTYPEIKNKEFYCSNGLLCQNMFYDMINKIDFKKMFDELLLGQDYLKEIILSCFVSPNKTKNSRY